MASPGLTDNAILGILFVRCLSKKSEIDIK